MLQHLHIQNYALISHLDIDFSAGFSTITGETGAGKSIILGALGLLMGGRADSKSITDGELKCVIEAEFAIDGYGLEALFEEEDLDYAPQTTIRRELLQSGKSRSFVNDTPVTLDVLKRLASKLIDIHSQHENLLLTDTAFQLRLVDSVAKNEAERAAYGAAYSTYNATQKELRALREEAEKAGENADYIAYQYHELETAKLVADELPELEAEEQVLLHAEDIQQALSESTALLDGEQGSVLSMLQECVSRLRSVSRYLTEDELPARAESAYIELRDIADTAARLAEDTEADPARLETIQARLDTLHTLMQKHRVESVEELITLRDRLGEQMGKNDSYELDINRLEKQLAAEEKMLTAASKALSKTRKDVVAPIKKQLESGLTQLGIAHAQVELQLTELNAFTPSGKDDVQILFAANKNQSLRDVAHVASGGEMARLMLCIKWLMADRQPTIIFDEIDTGVSGEVASRMGTIMHEMAAGRQVLTITHLPQIAAQGEKQYRVYKEDSALRTETHISLLTAEERVTEIAKMLSGDSVSGAAMENAKQLLNQS